MARRILSFVDRSVKQAKELNIYSAVVESGSIRQLAKNIGIGESTIRDVLKGRRGKVQWNTVTNAIDRYYSRGQKAKDKEVIQSELKRLPHNNRRQLAVKSKIYDYKARELESVSQKARRNILLQASQKRTGKLAKDIKPLPKGQRVLEDYYLGVNYDGRVTKKVTTKKVTKKPIRKVKKVTKKGKKK